MIVERDKSLWIGLDIGQAADPSALVVLEKDMRLADGADPFMSHPVGHYSIRHLQRWPLGTLYNKVVADTVALMNRPPLCPSPPKDKYGAVLVVDNTGIGRAITEDLRTALPGRRVVAVTISGSQMLKPNRVPGGWTVPKKDLAGVIQLCFGQNRLKAVKSKQMDQLVKELRTFTIKVKASTGNESYESLSARDKDDCVLALSMPLWLAECGEGPVPALRVLRLGQGSKGKPLQIYVCTMQEIAKWTDDRRFLLFAFKDPSPLGEEVVPSGGDESPGDVRLSSVSERVGEGVGQGQPIPHALPNVLSTRVLGFLDAGPGDYQESWNQPLDPWGRLPQDLLASPRDGKMIWQAVTKRWSPAAEAMVFCEEGEGDSRAFSAALAICDVLGLKREDTLVRTKDRDVTIKREEAPPNVHVYETVKAARSLVQ